MLLLLKDCFFLDLQDNLEPRKKEGNEDMLLIKWTKQLKDDGFAFNLHHGMIALGRQYKITVEIDILFTDLRSRLHAVAVQPLLKQISLTFVYLEIVKLSRFQVIWNEKRYKESRDKDNILHIMTLSRIYFLVFIVIYVHHG